jgi:hypothetical protein
MADWIFQAGAGEHDLDASIAASPERWWGTPRYRDRIAVGDRVWLQETGPHHPGLYYVATIMSATYEHPVQPGEPAYARWRTDIRVDYRISPPLLRSELLDDATLGSFRPFHGFQGSDVPVPPGIAAALAERAAPRLVALARPPRHGSLSAAEAERREWLDQVPAPEYEPGLREQGDPDLRDDDVSDPEP